MAATTAAPATGLLRSFERTDATLALVDSKLDAGLDAAFAGGAARLNPQRLLRRLAALEQEIAALKQASAQNAAARHSLGTLHDTLCASQAEALGLARRAHAPVDEEASAFSAAKQTAEEYLARLPIPAAVATAPPAPTFSAPPAPSAAASSAAPPAFHAAPPAPPVATTARAAPSAAASDDGTDGTASAQLVPAGARSAASAAATSISELQWLRLGSVVREGVSLDDLNAFYSVLRSLFVRRETSCLQAAQLLALGIRMSDANARYLRILQALGLVKLHNNELHWLA